MSQPIWTEMDKWAYDIECEYKKTGESTPKLRRQYINICAIRDKLYDKYVNKINELNTYDSGYTVPITKYCSERYGPPNSPPIPPPIRSQGGKRL